MSAFWDKEFGKFKHDFERVHDLPFTITGYSAVYVHRNLTIEVAGQKKRAGLFVCSFPQYMLSLGIADVILDQKIVTEFLSKEKEAITALENFKVRGLPIATSIFVNMTNVVPRDLNETLKQAIKCINAGSGKGMVHIAYPAPMIVGKMVEMLNKLTGQPHYVRFAPTLPDAVKIMSKFTEPLVAKED
jgi:hypothetical protein